MPEHKLYFEGYDLYFEGYDLYFKRHEVPPINKISSIRGIQKMCSKMAEEVDVYCRT